MFFLVIAFYIGQGLLRKIEASLCVPGMNRNRDLYHYWKIWAGGQRSALLLPKFRDIDLAKDLSLKHGHRWFSKASQETVYCLRISRSSFPPPWLQ